MLSVGGYSVGLVARQYIATQIATTTDNVPATSTIPLLAINESGDR
jgi:hypothetical protein